MIDHSHIIYMQVRDLLQDLSMYTEYLDNIQEKDLTVTHEPNVFMLNVDRKPYAAGKTFLCCTVWENMTFVCSHLNLVLSNHILPVYVGVGARERELHFRPYVFNYGHIAWSKSNSSETICTEFWDNYYYVLLALLVYFFLHLK